MILSNLEMRYRKGGLKMNKVEDNKEFVFKVKETITGNGVYINALPENTLRQVFEFVADVLEMRVEERNIAFENELGENTIDLDMTLEEFEIHEGSIMKLEIYIHGVA